MIYGLNWKSFWANENQSIRNLENNNLRIQTPQHWPRISGAAAKSGQAFSDVHSPLLRRSANKSETSCPM